MSDIMPTCPNCGEIVMNGDPYCPNCGTIFSNSNDRYEDHNSYTEGFHIVNLPVQYFYMTVNQLKASPTTIEAIKRDLDVTKVKDATVSIRQDYDYDDIHIDFKRQNKYITTTDSIHYDPVSNKIEGYRFYTNFQQLENTDWFIEAIKQKERETGKEYYCCGGAYDAHWDWENSKFELKEGCSVVAHFHEDEYNTRGYEVDFRYHKLKSESETYGKTSPYEIVADYDWVV